MKHGTEGKRNMPPNVDSQKNSRLLTLRGSGHDRWDILEARGDGRIGDDGGAMAE
jgi:hypothetical protein